MKIAETAKSGCILVSDRVWGAFLQKNGSGRRNVLSCGNLSSPMPYVLLHRATKVIQKNESGHDRRRGNVYKVTLKKSGRCPLV